MLACSGGQDNTGNPVPEIPDTTAQDTLADSGELESDERSNWQKPEFIISRIGKLEGKVLADLGSGALGYFTFKILGQTDVDKLIAIDIDKEAVRMLNILKEALNEEKASRLEIRLADVNDPKLRDKEVDIVLIVNTIAYLPNRLEYLKALKSKIKEDGKLVIVDFKTKRIPEDVDAPPYDERVLLHVVEEELYQAGYSDIMTDDTSLEYQYLIVARN